MNGKSENIVSYTAEELDAKLAAGEDQTDDTMSHDEAMRRRHADPEAPRPYEGWQDTIVPGIPEPKKQITLRVDAEVLAWFRAQGKGYQTLMNAVLKGYVDHQARNAD